MLAAAATATWLDPAFAPWLRLAALGAGCGVIYVLRGVALSGRGLAGLLDLAAAPVYVAWKLATFRRAGPHAAWTPTRRRAP